MNNIDFSKLVAPVYKDTLTLIMKSNRPVLLAGGRSSAKGTTVYIACIMYLLNNPNRTILVNAPIKANVGVTVFAQVKDTLDILNDLIQRITKSSFKITPKKITTSPYRIVFDNGSKFIFNGLLDGQKGTTGIDKVVIDEMGEIRGEYFGLSKMLSDLFLTYSRQGTQVIRIGNPPQHISAFFNQHISDTEKERQYFIQKNKKLAIDLEKGNIPDYEYKEKLSTVPYVLKTTCYDIPREWNNAQFWQQVEIMKLDEESGKSKAYSHQILGIPVGTGAEVFNNIVETTITTDFLATLDKNKIFAGLDFGYSADPMSFNIVYYDKQKQEMYILHEYYDKYQSIEQMVERINHYANCYDNCFTIHGDSQSSSTIAILQSKGINIIGYSKLRGKTKQEIEYMANNISTIYIDRKRTPNTFREFIEYQHKQDKSSNTVGDFSDKNNHSVDAVRYAIGYAIRNSVIRCYSPERGVL